MNHYGHGAQQWWQDHAPSRYLQLDDPEGFFTSLGEQIAEQVETISTALEATLEKALPYMQRVGQLRAIKNQAEEAAMTELVWSVAAEPANLSEQLEEILGQLPGVMEIDRALERMQDQAETIAEASREDEPIWANWMIEDRDALLVLRPLVNLTGSQIETMSGSELASRIEALTPWLANNPAAAGWHAAGPPTNPGHAPIDRQDSRI